MTQFTNFTQLSYAIMATIIRSLTVFCFFLLPSIVSAITFLDVWRYQVEGVESIKKKDIEEAVSPFMGAARTIKDIDMAAQAIQDLYKKAGYPTTEISVPEQDVAGGVIRIEVDESKIRRVKILGSRYFSLEGIRQSFPSLSAGGVLDISALQNEVKKSNQRNPDLKVVPALKAGPVPGTVDVDLNVADEFPLHGGIEYTNYNTETTTPSRLAADIRYGNLWQKNHEISLQVQITPENTDEVQVFAGSYLMPIGESGAKLAAYGVLSDSELAAVSDINVIGEGTILGFRWIQPISQSFGAVHSISAGLDYKDFDEELVFLGGENRETPISYTSFSAQYNFFHRDESVTDTLSTGISFGTRLLNEAEEFNEKKSQADASFALWKIDWKRAYELPKDWQLSHRLRGQISESPLVSNEQMSAGGVSSVRGYFESQVQGDSGVIANLELKTPQLFPGRWPFVDELTGHLFYDAAKVFINEALVDQERNIFIQSLGLGLQSTVFEKWHLKLEGGLPLEDEGDVNQNAFRIRASTRYEF